MLEREQALARLRSDSFDLLVIGGGATGSGIATDAANRGLRVALVEQNDYGEGTSSRSTKLVHGGVRYLEAAVKHLDRRQYALVREGLRERRLLLRNAPFLSRALELLTPLYHHWEAPYYYAGLRLYDLLAGGEGLGHSRLLDRSRALEYFPRTRSEGLKGAVLYRDGQFHDCRMLLALLQTAGGQGAVTANRLELVGLVRRQGRIAAAQVRDRIGGGEFEIRARGIINAAGPFVDRVRRLAEPQAPPLLTFSSGIHLVLGRHIPAPPAGLLIPRTDDGRVVFLLPWEGQVLVGTSEAPSSLSEHPRPTRDEVDYLLRQTAPWLDRPLSRADVASTWSGLRPLLTGAGASDTARLVREHLVEQSPTGLLTVAGGKWTSYRKMAEEVVNRAVAAFGLAPQSGCRTAALVLAGGQGWTEQSALRLQRGMGLPADVARHLDRSYGERAQQLAGLTEGMAPVRLTAAYPYLEAEVIHAVRHEQAQTVADVLCRRLSLALLDRQAALAVVDRVAELMAAELGWDENRCWREAVAARQRLTLDLTEA